MELEKTERRPLILFADDDEPTIDRFREQIGLYNWNAEFVRSAPQILAKINDAAASGRYFFDALVCKVNYYGAEAGGPGPMVSGVAAARVIRERHPDLPVVFISAHVSYFIQDEISKVGGELFRRPLDLDLLFERIAYLIKWNMATAGDRHKPERRRAGINLTANARRKTDVQAERLTIPPIIQKTIAEARESRRLLLSDGGH